MSIRLQSNLDDLRDHRYNIQHNKEFLAIVFALTRSRHMLIQVSTTV